MLEKINFNQKTIKKDYKKEMKELEKQLSSLQEPIKNLKIPVIICFEGWSASGKGTLISKLLYPLDPRNFKVHTMAKVNEEAYMRPVLWSYWTKTPSKGQITIFDKSWHRAGLEHGAENWKMKKKSRENFFYDVNSFEQQLADDGAVIIKLFLHISKEEQQKRFKSLEKNPATVWRIDENDWKQNEYYDKYLKQFENMLHHTNSTIAPWTIVEAENKKYASVKIYKTIISRLEKEIERRSENTGNIVASSLESKPQVNPAILDHINLNKDISEEDYKVRLKKLQAKIAAQGFSLYAKRKSVVIVYEGWDAAGKGGNIKRVTEELDPRGYEVIPIASPTKEELDHHYLWRFWTKMPKDGHITIFDRSWYGRVMVERVEGFCTTQQWQRAYKEINDMELHLHNHGTIIFKFWLHIDKDEQLLRFNARQNEPAKQYKITEEDWRNREKWDKYEDAVNEMLFKTSTEYAPWEIIESNSKKFARIKALEYITKELEKHL